MKEGEIIKTGEFYQGDLFSAIVQDLRLKAPHQLQTRNLFSLSKKPRHEPIVHRIVQDGEVLTVTVTNTSGSGIATVFDQDVLLFLISALVREYDETQVVSNRPEFAAGDYYKFKGVKKYAGTQSKQLYDAIHRLQNTFVEYVRETSRKQVVRFNWISYFDAVTNAEVTHHQVSTGNSTDHHSVSHRAQSSHAGSQLLQPHQSDCAIPLPLRTQGSWAKDQFQGKHQVGV